MEDRSVRLFVSETIGEVSAEYIMPDDALCLFTLAHGAGAGMNHVFMKDLAHALAVKKMATLRFNFPFIENKKKRADLPVVAHKACEAAIREATASFPPLPLFVSGKSFGGRMNSQYIAAHPDAPVKGIVFYGFPLHPAKQPAVDRAEHLKQIKLPMLFLQGTRDELAEWNLIESVTSALPTATLTRIEGADHAFKAGKRNVIEELVDETSRWVANLM
jgi:predicted alpha/beta-hydrolase family hydrolase